MASEATVGPLYVKRLRAARRKNPNTSSSARTLEETLSKSTPICSAKTCPPSLVCSLLEALNQRSAPALRRVREQMLVSQWGRCYEWRALLPHARLQLSGSSAAAGNRALRPSTPAPSCREKARLFVLRPSATVRPCKPRIAHPTRRLTLPSSGLAPAAQAWPSFHSGPSPRRLREPLMSNVRRLEEPSPVQCVNGTHSCTRWKVPPVLLFPGRNANSRPCRASGR